MDGTVWLRLSPLHWRHDHRKYESERTGVYDTSDGPEQMNLAYFRSLAARFFRRSQTENELEEELRAHIQLRADDLERSGLGRREAERRARIEFGGQERFKEESREAIAGNFIDMFIRDVRFGTRILLKNPGFTLVAVATLALGTGANTAVFSAFNSLVLRPLPFPSPDQLVRIYSTKNGAFIQ